MWQRLWQLLRSEGGFGRISVGAAMVIALGGGLGAYYVTQGGAPAGTANLWVVSGGASCTRLANPVEYANSGSPTDARCGSINTAYTAADVACGDLIGIEGNLTGTSTIAEVTGLSSCSAGNEVTIFGHDNPWVEIICFGTAGCGTGSSDAPDRLILRDFRTDGITLFGDADNVTLDGIDGGSFFFDTATNALLVNSDSGPCYTSGGNPQPGISRCVSQGEIQQSRVTGLANVTIRNTTFHDHYGFVQGDHFECLMFFSGTNVVVERSDFYNCATTGFGSGGIFFDGSSTIPGVYGTWYIQNNWFGSTPSGQAVSFGCTNGFQNGTVVVRYNSFRTDEKVHGHGIGCNEPIINDTIYVVGNVLGAPNCISGVVYQYNRFITGTPCSGTGNDTISAPYVDGSDLDAGGNYHLTGSPGSTNADNAVPNTASYYDLANDWDLQNRPIDTNRDAGSDER